MNSISKQLKERRESLNISKADLARAVGTSDVTIGYWESGQIKQIGHERLVALAVALDCSVSELIEDPNLERLKLKWQAEAIGDAIDHMVSAKDRSYLSKLEDNLYDQAGICLDDVE